MPNAAAAPWDVPSVRRERATLIALILLAAIARGIGLNGGLWIDEIYSLVRSFRAPLTTILTEYWGDNHHPFYALLAHASRAIFGESAWSVRLPAALCGVATVPALYLLALRLVSRREALLAALLLSVSYHHVWFSQNARGYSAIALCTVLTTGSLIDATRTSRTRDWVRYALVAALGAYTHLTMIFVVVGHALATAVFLLLRPERRRLLIPATTCFAGAAGLTLLFYAPMLQQLLAFFGQTKSGLRGLSTPSWAALETIRVLALGMSGGVVIAGVIALAGAATVGVAGVVSMSRRQPHFVALLACPIAVTVLGAALARGTLYPRFFFFAIGPALVVLVRGIGALGEWIASVVRRPQYADRVTTGGVGIGVVLSVASLGFNYRFPKQDYEGAMRYVVATAAPTDLVASSGTPADPYRTLYGKDWSNIARHAQLDSLRASGRRVWVLSTFPRYIAAADSQLAADLRGQCGQVRVFRGTVGGGDITVCRLDPK